AVDRDVENLDEAAKLHDRRDQTLESLADAFLQVRALEEGGHVAVGLVGALLEPRGALAQRAELARRIAHARAALGADQGLERAMYHQVRVAADRRREVCVVSERQPEMADVGRLIERLRHGPYHQRLDEGALGLVGHAARDRLYITRTHALRQARVDAE